MKNIKIKELTNSQVFFGKGKSGEFHDFKCWGDPTFVNGVWTIDCTDSGDYCYTFTEEDEGVLFEAEYEERPFRSGKKHKVAVAPSEREDESKSGFVLDSNNFIQVGETRFFEVTGSKESLDKFLKDNDLFRGGV